MTTGLSSVWRRDAGAALATVLVMLAIMSALAIVVVDASRFSLRRAANQATMEQTRWYILGAEAYAKQQIARVRTLNAKGGIDQDEWQGRPFTFPLDDGVMRIVVRDGSNCFNLNSMVYRTDDETTVVRASALIEFARLLDVLNLRTAGTPGATLADWLDSDDQTLAGGAEQSSYAQTDAPYRPANGPIGDISELRRIQGFTSEIVEAIAPFACVRPDVAPMVLNVNTLQPSQAALLAVTLGGDITPAVARDIIRARPRGGWADVSAFFAMPRLAGLEVSDSLRAQFDVASRYYLVLSRVERGDISESAASLIDTGGRVRVVRRIFGVGRSEVAL
ncbi:MAG: type II secretion system minor pseudopilin GspK [Hyphomonadaceae bacterium]|nr:type II secretion system minor pseudopilin GspK [Hyphomonadaceae bacterium]